MVIGILQCDDVRETLKEKHGNYPQMFISLFRSVDTKIAFNVYRVTEGIYPESIGECDAYITTGSRYSVNDGDLWIAKFQDFITELYHTKKKFVGICFGHQMMAKALGGEVVTSPKGWGIGVMTTRIKHRPAWMKMDVQQLDLLVSHRDQVTKMPKGSVLIAASEFCPYYMLQINEHFLGIQGHPEFSKSYAKDLMMARRGTIPPQRIKLGLESLTLAVDDELVSRMLLSFMR